MDEELYRVMKGNPFLKEYIEQLKLKTLRLPKYYERLSVQDLAEIRKTAATDPAAANLIYRTSGGFVHINAIENMYYNVEKQLTESEKEKMRIIKESILEKASKEDSVETKEDLERILNKLYDQSVDVSSKRSKAFQLPVVGKLVGGSKVPVTQKEYDLIKYYLRRDIVGFGPIEPLIVDNYIEDIHLIGT